MSYAAGFADGESQAWKDRSMNMRRVRQVPRNEYERGYWDGYCPRDPAWCLRRPIEQAWWQERESEVTV